MLRLSKRRCQTVNANDFHAAKQAIRKKLTDCQWYTISHSQSDIVRAGMATTQKRDWALKWYCFMLGRLREHQCRCRPWMRMSAKFLSGLLIQPRDDVVFWILVENSLNSILRAKHIQEKMQAQPECWLRNFCTWHYCHTGHPNAPLKLDTTTKDAIEMIWMEGQHSCVKNNCIQCLMPAAVIKQQQ